MTLPADRCSPAPVRGGRLGGASAPSFYPSVRASLAEILLVRRNANGAVVCAEQLKVLHIPIGEA